MATGIGRIDGSSLPAVSRGIGGNPVPDDIIIGLSVICGGPKSDGAGDEGASEMPGGADDITSGAALFAGNDCVEFDAVQEQISILCCSIRLLA